MGLTLPTCFGFVWAKGPAWSLALLGPSNSTMVTEYEVVVGRGEVAL